MNHQDVAFLIAVLMLSLSETIVAASRGKRFTALFALVAPVLVWVHAASWSRSIPPREARSLLFSAGVGEAAVVFLLASQLVWIALPLLAERVGAGRFQAAVGALESLPPLSVLLLPYPIAAALHGNLPPMPFLVHALVGGSLLLLVLASGIRFAGRLDVHQARATRPFLVLAQWFALKLAFQ